MGRENDSLKGLLFVLLIEIGAYLWVEVELPGCDFLKGRRALASYIPRMNITPRCSCLLPPNF